MALMNTAQKEQAARWLANQIYVTAGVVASMNVADLVGAIEAIDEAMDGLPTLLPNQAQSITQNLNTVLPDPFKTGATQAQKALAVVAWAGVKYDALDLF